MDRSSALEQLERGNGRERLAAARFLHAHATEDDREKLERFSRTESDHRVAGELRAALGAVALYARGVDRPIDPGPDEGDPQQASAETAARAITETTSMLVHEVRQVLPPLRHAAEQDLDNFAASETAVLIQRLDGKLAAIAQLGSAASAPVRSEFSLAELVDEVVSEECGGSTVAVEKAGRRPMLITSDRKLVNLAMCNGLRNAIEACFEVGESPPPIVVAWDETDQECWVVILDRGIGLPVGGNHAFDIGRTTKASRDHNGMGLAIAKQAVESLGGQISLNPRSDGGTAFEIRLPKT